MALRLPPSLAQQLSLTQSGSCLVQATHKRPRLACSNLAVQILTAIQLPAHGSFAVPKATKQEFRGARAIPRIIPPSHTPNHTCDSYPLYQPPGTATSKKHIPIYMYILFVCAPNCQICGQDVTQAPDHARCVLEESAEKRPRAG